MPPWRVAAQQRDSRHSYYCPLAVVPAETLSLYIEEQNLLKETWQHQEQKLSRSEMTALDKTLPLDGKSGQDRKPKDVSRREGMKIIDSSPAGRFSWIHGFFLFLRTCAVLPYQIWILACQPRQCLVSSWRPSATTHFRSHQVQELSLQLLIVIANLGFSRGIFLATLIHPALYTISRREEV